MGTYVDSQLLFSFSIADNADQTDIYDGIYASANGGVSFQKIIAFTPDAWTNGVSGRMVPYDLTKLLQSNFGIIPDTLILRFQQYGEFDFTPISFAYNTTRGFSLDDIQISVEKPVTYASLPFFDGFESGGLGSAWRVSSRDADGTTGPAGSLTRFPLARVATATQLAGISYQGVYGLALGKTRNDEGFNLNAVDLHLNLAGETDVQLSYRINRRWDEYTIEDGLWLSNNGGQSFVKIYDYNLNNLTSNTWFLQSLDLDSVMTNKGLSFSSNMILRFQQYDDQLWANSSNSDGIAFDNVSVTCTSPNAAYGLSVDCSNFAVTFQNQSSAVSAGTPYAFDFDNDGMIDTTILGGTFTHIYPGTGSYTAVIYVGNLNGCFDTVQKSIFIGSSVPAPSISPAGPQVSLCAGQTLNLQAQFGYQGYLWSTGATTPSIQVNASGVYTVRGLGIDGCYSTPTAITVVGAQSPPAPFISAAGPTTFCVGDSVQLFAPFGATNYQWSTGQTSSSIFASTTGTYSVTLTNVAGCQSPPGSISVTVSALPAPTMTASGPTTFCSGGSVTLNGPAGFNSYLWSNGATTQSISASISGTYTLIVNDGTCDSDPAAQTVTVNPTPAQPAITASGPTSFCDGGSVMLSGPSGAASYLWSNGATTSSITVSQGGSFTLQVSNASGCTSPVSATQTVTVSASPAQPAITASGPTSFCDGGSVMLSGPSGAASYLWSNGATTQNITVSQGGSFTLQVSNASGCTSPVSAAQTVTVNPSPAQPAITASGPTSFCDGGSVTLSGPAGATSYLWSNGATTQNITVSQGGSFTLQVSNASGCTSPVSAAQTVTVSATPLATITPSGETTFCAGDSLLLSGPAGLSTYLWSTGESSASIYATSAGIYTLQVVDASGCGSDPDSISLTVITVNMPTIFNISGSDSLDAGVAATSYVWYRNGAQIPVDTRVIDAKAFGSGTYAVQAIDRGCTSALSAEFAHVNTGIESAWGEAINVYPNPSTGRFVIEGEQHSLRALRIRVFNNLGQEVLPAREVAPAAQWTEEVDLSGHAEGIYYLRISDGRATFSRQLVVQR